MISIITSRCFINHHLIPWNMHNDKLAAKSNAKRAFLYICSYISFSSSSKRKLTNIILLEPSLNPQKEISSSWSNILLYQNHMIENHIIFQENPNRKINKHGYEERRQNCRANSNRKFKQYDRCCHVNIKEKLKKPKEKQKSCLVTLHR